LIILASQERFELPTDGLEGRCSIQLSYWDIFLIRCDDTKYFTTDYSFRQPLFLFQRKKQAKGKGIIVTTIPLQIPAR
jgi:hypothetical protein